MVFGDRKSLHKRLQGAVFRFLIYGSVLVAGEVSFYTIVKVGRQLPFWLAWAFQFQWAVDARLELGHVWDAPVRTLYGQASMWMFFVYGCIALFGVEPAYHHVKSLPWVVRGVLYTIVILSMECAAGWILRALTGYDIWYYEDGVLTILRYTSLAIAPAWFAVGLISESFIRLVDKLTRIEVELTANQSRS
jgi:hypothetical protein